MKIAILSPSSNAYSETFIRAHVEFLDGEKRLFYGATIPDRVEGVSANDSSFTLAQRIRGKIFPSDLVFSETALQTNLMKFNPDVVLAEYGTTGANSLRVISRLRIPMVVHFHGFDAFKYSIIEEFKQKYISLFEYASFVVVVSGPMKKQLIQLGCPESKIIINRCGPNNEFLNLNPEYSKKMVLSVGRFTDKKAPYYTLLAFSNVIKRIPEANMIMAGDGDLFETVKNLVAYFGIKDKVSFPGSLNHQEILGLYQQACVYTQHSIQTLSGDCEGTPVSVIEASAAGLPVVSTNHAGIPEVVKDGISGFILNEHDVAGISEKLVILLNNPDLSSKMGKAGREIILENFTMKKHIDILNDLLRATSEKKL